MTAPTPLGKSAITPELVAHHLLDVAKDLESVFCVGFTKDGEIIQFHSGMATQMALAAGILQFQAVRASNEAFDRAKK